MILNQVLFCIALFATGVIVGIVLAVFLEPKHRIKRPRKFR